jgi:hypothetical protein
MKPSPSAVALLLALAVPAAAQDRAPLGDHPVRLAQAADTTTTTPSVTPVTPNSTSATCLSARSR